MTLKEIVAISGMGGLFQVTAQRTDGLIVRGFNEDKSKFVSNRIHIFTPLDGITIYTNDDSAELLQVFVEMKKQEASNPPPTGKADNQKLKDYFKAVLPDYDEEKVYVSDIKKILKWYNLLDEQGLVTTEEEPEETEAEESTPTTEEAEPAEESPVEEAEETIEEPKESND